MNEIREYVLNLLQREYDFKNDKDVDMINYLEEGYVNSLALIQFVVELEEKFDVEFTEDEIDSPDFKIIGKLINLIERKVNKK